MKLNDSKTGPSSLKRGLEMKNINLKYYNTRGNNDVGKEAQLL